MSSNDIILLTAEFIKKHLVMILFVTIIMFLFRVYISANGITFKKHKTKVAKVIMIEKMQNGIPTLDEFNHNVREQLSTKESCDKLKNKERCAALGSCVWANVKDSGSTIEKCVLAEKVGENKTKGSRGPLDMCFCSKKGKLIPWDKYYYMKNMKIKEGTKINCVSKGNSCK